MRVRRSRKHNYLRATAAYTLAEVVMAVAVVGVVFVALYSGIVFCFDVTRSERENLRATQVLLRRMEGIRLFNWNQLSDTTLNPLEFYERFFPGSPGIPASGVTYTGRVEVAALDCDPPPTYSTNMRMVTVTLTWTSKSGLQTRSAFTYVARDGIQNYVYASEE
jgi:type II secretory pathway pseudopilin PulG